MSFEGLMSDHLSVQWANGEFVVKDQQPVDLMLTSSRHLPNKATGSAHTIQQMAVITTVGSETNVPRVMSPWMSIESLELYEIYLPLISLE